jgi:cytochrome c-type biogenesis protein CcmF
LGFDGGVEPHRRWRSARLEVTDDRGGSFPLAPRMNFFERSNDPIGTPAVKSTASGDLYISLLAFTDEDRTATFNAWIFPMVGWIWWSIPILVLGALIAMWPSRKSGVSVSTLPSRKMSLGKDFDRGAA